MKRKFYKKFQHKATYQFITQLLETVATLFLLLFSNFVETKFSYVEIELLWLLNNLCHDIIFFCLNKLFFSGLYHCISYLLRHRNLCYDRLDLANLNSLSVVIEFSSVAIEFYHSIAFIVATKNFFVATKILHSILHYVAT